MLNDKRILCGCLFVLVFLAVQANAASIQFSLHYTFSTTGSVDAYGNYPGCSSTRVKLCVTGFRIYETTSGSPVLTAQMRLPSKPSGPQVMAQTFTLLLAAGAHTFVATTCYLDANGKWNQTAQSAPVTLTLSTPPPNSPTEVTATRVA